MGTCPICGWTLVGDGFTSVIHCENAEVKDYWDHEPDACPVYCTGKDIDNAVTNKG